MPDACDCPRLPATVRLFPLPNVVLFPRAILPLHIFEERYKMMTAHALDGDRHIAMALLHPGWERHYCGRAAIDPVVCVGRILNYERLSDGRYNLLLEGTQRAKVVSEERIVCERTGVSYRLAQIQSLEETPILEIDLEDARRQLREIFQDWAFDDLQIGLQFRRLVNSPIPTRDMADLIAFTFLDDVRLKQSLLRQTDVRQRVQRVVDEMSRLVSQWRSVPVDAQVN